MHAFEPTGQQAVPHRVSDRVLRRP